MVRPLEAWLGVWQLDPATLRYEHGRPGRRALYTIERADAGLTFHLDADDPDGRLLKFTYGGPLDGVGRDIGGGARLVLTQVDERTIDSALDYLHAKWHDAGRAPVQERQRLLPAAVVG